MESGVIVKVIGHCSLSQFKVFIVSRYGLTLKFMTLINFPFSPVKELKLQRKPQICNNFQRLCPQIQVHARSMMIYVLHNIRIII